MPRKTKELENRNEKDTKKTIKGSKATDENEVITKSSVSKKSTAPKTNLAKSILEKATQTVKTVAKKATEKKANIKKDTAKKEIEEKDDVKKKSATKKAIKEKTDVKKSPIKKDAEKKADTKKAATKKVAEKKATSKKSTEKKTNVKKSTANSKNTLTKITAPKTTSLNPTQRVTTVNSLKVYSPEYYDLPFKYNKTVITILAQTPTTLFVYWEISDEDRQNLKNQYGEYFFEITKPVLIIHNITKNYSFEIDVDDFANSWYINVEDSNCEYKIELGRRPIPINYSYIPQYDFEKNGPIQPITNPYIYISSSNNLISPNDHVLFNWSDEIYFKNVKTNEVIVKQIKDLSFIDKYGEIINLYELYQKQYGDDFLKGPSFWNPSSMGTSSKFK